MKAIRDFLLSLRTRVDGAANSDADVGPKAMRGNGLEGLMEPLEAGVLRVAWAAKVPVSVRPVLQELNERRPTPSATRRSRR